MLCLLRLLASATLLLLPAAAATVSGKLTDPQGKPVAGAVVRLTSAAAPAIGTTTDEDGNFHFAGVHPGNYAIEIDRVGFADLRREVGVTQDLHLDLQFTRFATQSQSVTVTASVQNAGILFPDPAERILVRQKILDANPGRPGVPVSIPGLPAETASGGIKAPQYFAPGVAGDHGEPIAQYFQIGDYLMPNNLSANAHGNGYADPNIVVPAVIESVQTDGGAFNVREGNHSVDVAAIYGLRDRLEPFVTLTGDYRDVDLTAG